MLNLIIVLHNMADLGDTKFYDLNTGGNTTPPVEKNFNKKKIVTIVVSILGSIIFLAILLGVYMRWQDVDNIETIKSEADSLMARDIAECQNGEDPNACEQRVKTKIAREMGEILVCEGLDQKLYINCVSLIAVENLEVRACEALEGESVNTCKDAVYLRLAQNKKDYGICEKILDDDKRSSCEKILLSTVIKNDDCVFYGLDSIICNEGQKLQAIVEDGDYIECAELSTDKLIADCHEMFTVIDRDGDGLLDMYEVDRFGTDPRNPDTDGDGYSDFDEVNNGFDPLG